MADNPYGLLTVQFGDLRYVDTAMHDAWQEGHDSRNEEVEALKAEREALLAANRDHQRMVEALKAELAELRDLSLALVRATRQSLQVVATVSVAEEAADAVEAWLEEK